MNYKKYYLYHRGTFNKIARTLDFNDDICSNKLSRQNANTCIHVLVFAYRMNGWNFI